MRHVLTAVAVSLVSLALFACGGETTPSADAPAGGTTATGTTATAGGTTATATAAQPRDSSGMSLDESWGGKTSCGPPILMMQAS